MMLARRAMTSSTKACKRPNQGKQKKQARLCSTSDLDDEWNSDQDDVECGEWEMVNESGLRSGKEERLGVAANQTAFLLEDESDMWLSSDESDAASANGEAEAEAERRQLHAEMCSMAQATFDQLDNIVNDWKREMERTMGAKLRAVRSMAAKKRSDAAKAVGSETEVPSSHAVIEEHRQKLDWILSAWKSEFASLLTDCQRQVDNSVRSKLNMAADRVQASCQQPKEQCDGTADLVAIRDLFGSARNSQSERRGVVVRPKKMQVRWQLGEKKRQPPAETVTRSTLFKPVRHHPLSQAIDQPHEQLPVQHPMLDKSKSAAAAAAAEEEEKCCQMNRQPFYENLLEASKSGFIDQLQAELTDQDGGVQESLQNMDNNSDVRVQCVETANYGILDVAGKNGRIRHFVIRRKRRSRFDSATDDICDEEVEDIFKDWSHNMMDELARGAKRISHRQIRRRIISESERDAKLARTVSYSDMAKRNLKRVHNSLAAEDIFCDIATTLFAEGSITPDEKVNEPLDETLDEKERALYDIKHLMSTKRCEGRKFSAGFILRTTSPEVYPVMTSTITCPIRFAPDTKFKRTERVAVASSKESTAEDFFAAWLHNLIVPAEFYGPIKTTSKPIKPSKVVEVVDSEKLPEDVKQVNNNNKSVQKKSKKANKSGKKIYK